MDVHIFALGAHTISVVVCCVSLFLFVLVGIDLKDYAPFIYMRRLLCLDMHCIYVCMIGLYSCVVAVIFMMTEAYSNVLLTTLHFDYDKTKINTHSI